MDTLQDALRDVEASPTDLGTVEMIVVRPALEERTVLDEATIDAGEGVVGDTWRERPSRSSPDGGPHPDAQITLMNSRAVAAVAGDRGRWPLAGDQFYVDFDISEANLPPGTRIGVGAAVLEVSAKPHTGCAKFRARFGEDASRWINSPEGRALRLRGVNARVVTGGVVRVGDAVEKLTA